MRKGTEEEVVLGFCESREEKHLGIVKRKERGIGVLIMILDSMSKNDEKVSVCFLLPRVVTFLKILSRLLLISKKSLDICALNTINLVDFHICRGP